MDHAASRTQNARLRLFYLRVAARRRKKKAVVVLARKILCIIYQLLVNEEDYIEEGYVKLPKVRYRELTHIP